MCQGMYEHFLISFNFHYNTIRNVESFPFYQKKNLNQSYLSCQCANTNLTGGDGIGNFGYEAPNSVLPQSMEIPTDSKRAEEVFCSQVFSPPIWKDCTFKYLPVS